MTLDALADSSRRAWIWCPECGDGASCAVCASSKNCPEHWSYLLESGPHWVLLQCLLGLHIWYQALPASRRAKP